jgi:hypothetical protein
MGTSVISGTATAIVYRTGRATQLGGVARALTAQRPSDAFEHGIRRFGFLMLRFTVFLVLFVLAANVLFQRPWLESLLFALALAVGLTPELLPMVVTVTLANGARRLARRRVIVKRLAAIHDLGAMEVLCTDKTGTLTESKIRLVGHVDAMGRDSERVLRAAYLNSAFESGIKSPLDDAILAHGTIDISAWHKIDEVPFDFERRRVSVLVDDGVTRMLIVKGAPEDRRGGRRQGGRGPRPARARPRRDPGQRDRGATDGRERQEVHLDGRELEPREHVQHGGRRAVSPVPADAAGAGAAQQSPLRHARGGRAVRPRGRRRAATPALGHPLHRAIHARARADQLVRHGAVDRIRWWR